MHLSGFPMQVESLIIVQLNLNSITWSYSQLWLISTGLAKIHGESHGEIKDIFDLLQETPVESAIMEPSYLNDLQTK